MNDYHKKLAETNQASLPIVTGKEILFAKEEWI